MEHSTKDKIVDVNANGNGIEDEGSEPERIDNESSKKYDGYRGKNDRPTAVVGGLQGGNGKPKEK
ncbi:hypothetical protein GALMADRAFT_243279 [Galerina marginata CBS 339.88]|uniref:Uncharacterized protein n=1 Tax=Galerina marginata (strain CBS 339.88) TaxID=685588 RepID=A0A067TK12_GALM3|nr:hypothetical protein GALMADRAFT_243279 [Galerina marginata CBS 339.88]